MVKVEYRKINEQTTYTAQNDVSYRIVIKIIERIVILPIRSINNILFEVHKICRIEKVLSINEVMLHVHRRIEIIFIA